MDAQQRAGGGMMRTRNKCIQFLTARGSIDDPYFLRLRHRRSLATRDDSLRYSSVRGTAMSVLLISLNSVAVPGGHSGGAGSHETSLVTEIVCFVDAKPKCNHNDAAASR
jgi:hypothetical protein